MCQNFIGMIDVVFMGCLMYILWNLYLFGVLNGCGGNKIIYMIC